MTGRELLTVERVLAELLSLRRDVTAEIGGLRTDVNTHMNKIDIHLDNQDARLRFVEVASAVVKASDDERQKAQDDRANLVTEGRVTKRWIIGTMLTVVTVLAGLITFLLRYVLPPST